MQRAHDKYSFSHLTLHEYLAACHYYKSGRSREVSKATLSKERWREVHLLLAGLQEPHADAFLLAIATTTAEQVTSEHLKGLLYWAEQVVRVDGSPQQTAAKRALMIVFALARDLARDLDRASARANGSSRAVALARALDLARDLDLNLDLDFVLDLARDLDLARVLDRDPTGVPLGPRGRASASDLDQILGSIIRRTLTGAALEELANTPGFPPLEPHLSEMAAQQYSDFLICTRRVFECREAAERVTQAGWDRVCERLFALPRST